MPKLAKDEKVAITRMGEPELVLPEYFATRSKKGWKLVNPLTQERNLATRNGETSVKLSRKAVADGVLIDGKQEIIHLSLFSPKDREIIRSSFERIETDSRSVKDKPKITMGEVKERGRPEKLMKNIEINRERKADAKKLMAKPKGRPNKYGEDEDARKLAKKEQDKIANQKRTEKRRQSKLQGGGLSDDEDSDEELSNIMANISIDSGKKKKTAQETAKTTTTIAQPQGIQRPVAHRPQLDKGTKRKMEGGGLEDQLIDFEDIKWGSFSKQFKEYNRTAKKPLNDLENFANMIMKTPEKFKPRTIKRARFYLNVLLKKQKNNISTDNIEMPKKSKMNGEMGMGLYAGMAEPSGRGMYAGDGMYGNGMYAGDGMYGNGMYAGDGMYGNGFFGDLAKSALKSGANMAVDAGANYAKNRIMGTGVGNRWVEHIRAFAKKNNMTYGCAMSDPRIKDGYIPSSKRKSKKSIEVPVPKIPKVLTTDEETQLKKLKKHLERMDMMKSRGIFMDEDQREEIENAIKEISGNGFFGDLAKSALKSGANMAVDAGANYAKNRIMGTGMCGGGHCAMCGGAIYNPTGDPKIAEMNDHIRRVMSHQLQMGMSGQGIFGDIGRWFKKAGKTISKSVLKPIAGFAIREGLPALANLAGDVIGQPELGALATPLISKGADALARSAGVGMKKPNAWIALVKRVQNEKGVSYKEAMSIASQMRR